MQRKQPPFVLQLLLHPTPQILLVQVQQNEINASYQVYYQHCEGVMMLLKHDWMPKPLRLMTALNSNPRH